MFDKLITDQAKLFNTELNNDQIEYIINNNIVIYSDFLDIEYSETNNFLIEDNCKCKGRHSIRKQIKAFLMDSD